jgi:ribosomal protein S6
VKKYEGLFILEVAGKEEDVGKRDSLTRIQKTIEQAGGRVETVQRMGPRPFARDLAQAHAPGYYVNYRFPCPAQGDSTSWMRSSIWILKFSAGSCRYSRRSRRRASRDGSRRRVWLRIKRHGLL